MTDMVPSASFPTASGGVGMGVPLSRKAKAAIVVRLLIGEGADIPLEDLPEELQACLTQQMGSMRTVDRATLSAVVQEFAQNSTASD